MEPLFAAIALVTGPLTLAAFIYAAYAWVSSRSQETPPSLKELAIGDETRSDILTVLNAEHRLEALKELLRIDEKVIETVMREWDAATAAKDSQRARSKQALISGAVAVLLCGVSVLAWKTAISQKVSANVVPPPLTTPKPREAQNTLGTFSTVRDISIFDLRGWQRVDDGETNRVSPVGYTNYLHVKKLKESVEPYLAHYSTGGLAIDLRVITHRATVFNIQVPEHPNGRTYELAIDVSNEPVGSEFLIVVEATYWNSFQNGIESASTYTDPEIRDLRELGLLILFPPKRPFHKDRRLEGCGPEADKDMHDYQRTSSYFTDMSSLFIYWGIAERRQDCHYKVVWEW